MLRRLRRLFRRGPSDEERVADACMGARSDGLIPVNVVVREEPGVPRMVPTKSSLAVVVGPAADGPVSEPVLIGPSVRRPRWWEVWRWHRYPRWRRESRGAARQFEAVFGRPQ